MNLPRLGAACAALLLIPALASCSSDSQSPTTSTSSAAAQSPSAGNAVAPLPTGGAELADTKWALSGASHETGSLAGTRITLDFTADTAGGNGGVNTFTAGYTSAAEGTLTFSDIASTAMAGDDAAMKAKDAYLAALKTVTGYSINGGLLDLFAGPDQVLTFTSAS